jgi:acetate kinase
MVPENSNLLTINGGSSSIKFATYEMAKTPKLIFSGSINRIGLTRTTFNVSNLENDEKTGYEIYCPDFFRRYW